MEEAFRRLLDREEHARLLDELCRLTREVVEAARVLEPLKLIDEWVRRGGHWMVELVVLAKPVIVQVRGELYSISATMVEIRAPGWEGWYLFASPIMMLRGDDAKRSILAHELLHAAGIYSEDEADWRVDEAARLRPDLFSKIWYVRTGEALLALAAMDFLGADNIIIVPAEPRTRAAATLLFSASVKKPLAYCVER
ncbi:MAG: hypothetical protein QXT37_09255 [Thermofilaceae archaeon]